MLTRNQPWDWYFVTREDIEAQPQGSMLLQHYGSLANALKDLKPNVGWDETKFHRKDVTEFWNSRENRRVYFNIIGQHLGIGQVLSLNSRILFSYKFSRIVIRLVFDEEILHRH